MKKLLAVLMAVAMLCAMSVTVFADEVVYSEDTMFWKNGNWESYTTELGTDTLAELLSQDNAYLVFTRSNTPDGMAYPEHWEKFCILDAWWSGSYDPGSGTGSQWIAMGTANHTIAMAEANDQQYDVHIDAVLDDGIQVWYSGADIMAAWTAGNFNVTGGGDTLYVISNSSPDGVYSITNVSVIVTDAPVGTDAEEAPADDANTEAPAENTEAPADTTETTETPVEKEPANTGIALAVVPMMVAAAAVALSKKR